MGKGSYYLGKSIVTVEGIKGNSGGSAISVGNAVEVDTALFLKRLSKLLHFYL